MSSLQPPSLPAWDFDDLLSGSESEVDFSRQPYELQQQSVRKPSSNRTTSTDNAAGGGGYGGVSPLAAGPIPQGPNRPRSAGGANSSSSTAPYFPREGEVLMQRSSSTLQQQPPHQPSQRQQASASQPAPSSPIKASRARSSSGTGLNRSQTLLSHSASPYRSSQELSRLLAKSPSSRKLGGGADGRAEDDARLEAGRRKARVTLDVDLEREVLVEGGDVKGTMVVLVRPGPKKEGPVHVGQGKIRLVGFEDVPSHNGRHIFYHHSATLPLFMPGAQHRSSLFTPTPGTHHPSNVGSHPVPFHLPLPLTDFPRGPHRSSSSSIRYILVASISLFFPLTGTSSIAHFYRNVVVYPKIDPARVLGTGAVVESARSFGTPGGKGVELGVKLGKSVWVAGMSCWVDISMYNGTNKKIKSLTVQLWQTSVLYHPSLSSTRPNSAHTGVDPGSTSTKQKKVAETVLQEAQASGVGRITGKGWFTGCGPMTAGAWSTSLLLPSDALSIPRGRLIEVGYSVRVSVDSKIVVEVPIRIVNFISIDPPPSTYRAPTPPTTTVAPVKVVALAAPLIPVDTPGSPKSTYTDGVIGYDTISRPRGSGLGASTLGNGTLASTLKKARSMGSLAFPGEMGNRLSSSSGGGPLRVANRHSSDDESGADDDDDENDRMADADEDALERRGLIRRKASMAVLKEAVDAAARENDGFDELHEQAYGYSYEADLGVDIPKLVEEGSSSTYVAVGEDTLAEEDEDEEAEEVVVLDRPSSSLMLGRPASSPLSPSQTVVSEEGAFAYDEGSLAPTVRSHLPALTPTSELPPSLPPSSIGMESSASIGQAMQSLLLDDASSDSDDNDEDLYEAGPRFPIKPRPSSPALRAARAASMVSLSPNNPRERQGSDATFVSARSHHPSHRLSTAWGAAAGGSSSRPASTYAPTTHEPTYEEVRNAIMQGRRQSALTPEPAFRSNGRLSINTDLIHPETIAKPRTPSPHNQVIPLPPASPSGLTSSPAARSVNQRKSFTFASPAAPIRVKASVGSREGGSPARLRASKSSVNLARSATQDSPVKTRSAVFPPPATVSSPARPASAYGNHTFGSGRDSPTKLDPSSSFVAGAAGSPRRSRTVHSPTKGAPAIREVPALTDHHASSDSGSASEVTPPLSASAFPPIPTTVTALQFADKLQFTNRHLSQHFDPSFDATKLGAGGPPRANSFDVNALPSRVRPPGSPSVKSKIQNLEAARPASTPPSEGPPQLRRSATTASPRYGPSDDLKFIRPGVHRRDTSVATVDEDLDVLAAESNLRRAPSGVSFKAPLLRHSKSMAGNLRQN